MPFIIQCFRLIFITFLQNQYSKNDKIKSKINKDDIFKLKQKEKNFFGLIKKFISPQFQVTFYSLGLLINVIFFLTIVFSLDFVYIKKDGCNLQLIAASKQICTK
jgi:hypothetical protein